MIYTLPEGARLYRVTAEGETWPTPIRGLGAYFTRGGRFNGPAQPTIYCTEDPLAAVAEAAFYDALNWQQGISGLFLQPIRYPLITRHKFWCFSITPGPTILDLESSSALACFKHPLHLLTNPSLSPGRHPSPTSRNYQGTRELADAVRDFKLPEGSPVSRPEGVRAPAIRLARTQGYRPRQLALFVYPPELHIPYEQRSRCHFACDLELEFLDLAMRSAVSSAPGDIDWSKPRFRFLQLQERIPPFLLRHEATEFLSDQWYDVTISFV